MSTDRKIPQRCKMIKGDGTRCKAIAGESGYCSIHSGLVPQLERKTNLEGGAIEVRKFLSKIAMSLKRGKIKAHDANALVNICNALLRCEELIEVRTEIKKISETLKNSHDLRAEYQSDLDCLMLED